MSGLFRSEDMTYVRVIMSDDSAYDTVKELGKFKKLHILDLAEGHQGQAAPAGSLQAADQQAALAESSYTYYKKRIALCQFWERKFLTFKDAFKQYKIKLPDPLNPLEVVVDDIRSADVIEDCRQYIEPIEENLTKNVVFRKQHKQQINEFIEYLKVIKFNADNQFSNVFSPNPVAQSEAFSSLDEEKMESGGNPRRNEGAGNRFTSTICGVIPVEKIAAFERLLFRVSRGNAFSRFFEIEELIEDPTTGEKVKKHVFNVTFMGEQLSKRVSRIIQHAGGTEYPLPGSPNEILGLQRDIELKLNDSMSVLSRTDTEIREILNSLAVDRVSRQAMPYNSPYFNWLMALQRERHICNILKKCEQENIHSKVITLEGWCPDENLDELRLALAQAVRVTQAKQAALQVFDHPPNAAIPPTYFKTNAFTGSFQAIVDTYGVPRYKEVNPGLFTIISFPFLFGIMYGDIGHGTLLFLFAAFLLWNEKKFEDANRRGELGEIPSMIFGGRYLLFMMGFFALYVGTVYNDCFSNPVHAFPSHWTQDVLTNVTTNTTTGAWAMQNLTVFTGSPYPYGVDPGWYHTTNELAFFNSMKMKLAVTLGVTQMVFGIFLGAANDVYYKDYLAIFFEFLPRLLFILCTFGYMVFIIILKMCIAWGPNDTPPLLIQTMIQMFLSPGNVTDEMKLYDGQGVIQAALVLIAVFSIPFMLLGIPCITNCRNKVFLRKLALLDGEHDGGREIQMHAMPGTGSKKNSIALGHMAGDPSDSPDSPRSDHGLGHTTGRSAARSLSEKLIDEHPSDSNEVPIHRPSNAVIIDDRSEAKEPEFSPEPIVAVHEEPHADGGHGEHALGKNYSYGDHMIVQGIHTIEFVLGTVSNTASYLRLWALSLAHAELSSVFWDKMIMQYGLLGSNAFSPVVGFAIWGVATFAVLLAMDVLECFLHALRLHWVEFQNKFFRADGYAFEPFSFDNLGEDKTN